MHGKETLPVNCTLNTVGDLVQVKEKVQIHLPSSPVKKRFAYKVKNSPPCASQGELVEENDLDFMWSNKVGAWFLPENSGTQKMREAINDATRTG